MPPLFITMILVTALLLVVAVARRSGSLKGVLGRDVRSGGQGGPAVAYRPALEDEPAEATGEEAEDALAAEAEGDGFDPATGWSEPEWHWEVDPPRMTAEAGEAGVPPLEAWTADGQGVDGD